MPDSYWVFQSNPYYDGDDDDDDDDDDNSIGPVCLDDPQCINLVTNTPTKRSGQQQALLTCTGPSSTLFDGVIGREIDNDPVNEDLLRHYTWRQGITPNPYVAMSFTPPLVEVPNITLYLYREGRLRIRGPEIRMCFSTSPTFSPCTTIELPRRPRLQNGVVVWSVMLTNVTSVTYLRIDFQHEPRREDATIQFIFLSEIRVAERLQEGSYRLLDVEL